MFAPTESTVHHRPCLLLAHANPAFAAACCRAFRRLGWDVYQAQNGPQLRRLIPMLEAELVILDVDLVEQSGWWTCARLSEGRLAARILLVGPVADSRTEEMAHFVGAHGFVCSHHGPTALVRAAVGSPQSAAS